MRTLAAILVATALAVPAGAAQILEEFDYGDNSGTFVTGIAGDGGQGWGDDWAELKSEYDYVPGSLSYTVSGYTNGDLGGRLKLGGGGTNSITRPFASAFGAGSTVWGSFLLKSPSNGKFGGFNSLRLEINGDGGDSVGFRGVSNGDDGEDPPEPKVDGVLRARINGTNHDVATAGQNVVNLLIFKLETDYSGTDDRLTLWTNPAGPITDEASLGAGNAFDGVDIWGSSIGSVNLTGRWADGRSEFDSLRLSDVSLQQVLIPEPATLAVLALGGIAVLRRRK